MLSPFPENAARGNVCASTVSYNYRSLSSMLHVQRAPVSHTFVFVTRKRRVIEYFLEHVEMKEVTVKLLMRHTTQ